jgi:hypothetical protein
MSLGTCMRPSCDREAVLFMAGPTHGRSPRLLLIGGERAEQLTTGELGVLSGCCLDCACRAVESLVQPEVIGGQ